MRSNRLLRVRMGRCLLWVEMASKGEPYWWNADAGGNRCRHIFTVQKSFDRLSPAVALVLIIGRLKITYGRL